MGYRSVTDEGVQSALVRAEYLAEFLREADAKEDFSLHTPRMRGEYST